MPPDLPGHQKPGFAVAHRVGTRPRFPRPPAVRTRPSTSEMPNPSTPMRSFGARRRRTPPPDCTGAGRSRSLTSPRKRTRLTDAHFAASFSSWSRSAARPRDRVAHVGLALEDGGAPGGPCPHLVRLEPRHGEQPAGAISPAAPGAAATRVSRRQRGSGRDRAEVDDPQPLAVTVEGQLTQHGEGEVARPLGDCDQRQPRHPGSRARAGASTRVVVLVRNVSGGSPLVYERTKVPTASCPLTRCRPASGSTSTTRG